MPQTGAKNRGHRTCFVAAGFPQFQSKATKRSEEHTSELQSQSNLVCRLLLRRRPSPTLFPYTTLFRSERDSFFASLKRPPEHIFATYVADLHCDLPCFVQLCHKLGPKTAGIGLASLRLVFLSSKVRPRKDRKSTRLNSSHSQISYAVFCCGADLALLSFPTRRSSDLNATAFLRHSSVHPNTFSPHMWLICTATFPVLCNYATNWGQKPRA